jgi:hypothetical protein
MRTSAAIDWQCLVAADQFQALELSPVAPLGTCSAVIALRFQRAG